MKYALLLALGFAADDSKINISFTGADQAKQWKGKRVSVLLKSGKELEGTVGEVSSFNLELKQLQGKEYFDAIIKLDDVSAYIYRTRQ